ncbi:uncharacterized protein YukE [Arthrobacter pigmenti]|uniref:Uncharacterized protein YukE n=1 Tax=Arthrobacter pigmenti TaxID=271432 RepID=A0A846RVM8_9MICC|nr:hypothetical protein [Arthrobacter pigmenti]NJC23086.1 uncharacterized protein YukE [Arthrobacter pigmenti]
MTGDMIGANPEQLRDLARSMGSSSQTITAADQTITSVLSGMPWNGPDASQFRNRWHTTIRVQLNQTAAMLDQQSRLLVDQATQQDTTSNDDDGGSGSSGSGSGGSGSSNTDAEDDNPLDLLNLPGDLGAWPPYQIANWVTSAGGLGAERLLNAMSRAGLLTPDFGTAQGVGYLRGTQTLNALNMAGRFAGGLSVLTGLGQTYQGIQSGDGHVIADGAITTILAAGSLTPTPAAPFFAAASLVWAGAQFLSGDVPVTERITDFASDAGDVISDGAGAVADGAKDAWNWAFG